MDRWSPNSIFSGNPNPHGTPLFFAPSRFRIQVARRFGAEYHAHEFMPRQLPL